MDENDDEHRTGTITTGKGGHRDPAAKKPEISPGLFWTPPGLGLTRPGSCTASTLFGRDESVTTPIHGAQITCSRLIQLERLAPHPLDRFQCRPRRQSQSRTPVVGARTHSFQVPTTLGPVKPSRRPPWDSSPNHQHEDDTLKRALPPFTDEFSHSWSPLDASSPAPSSKPPLHARRPWLRCSYQKRLIMEVTHAMGKQWTALCIV
ncbi:hypothetical protein FZEAL_9514 [Fusarium zealandicum]|uniref:Uncharacterized protein n=1 Tax=Fusarium zealandicum TaxID=1053134 RepID=A0A8H4UBD5_9HYPO|nr:hypothetical protein FZEAL_9514 [Fusarium zealandicum]